MWCEPGPEKWVAVGWEGVFSGNPAKIYCSSCLLQKSCPHLCVGWILTLNRTTIQPFILFCVCTHTKYCSTKAWDSLDPFEARKTKFPWFLQSGDSSFAKLHLQHPCSSSFRSVLGLQSILAKCIPVSCGSPKLYWIFSSSGKVPLLCTVFQPSWKCQMKGSCLEEGLAVYQHWFYGDLRNNNVGF